MKYVKKPLPVEAFQINEDLTKAAPEFPLWVAKAIDIGEDVGGIQFTDRSFVVMTMEGNMISEYGDYLIKGIYDELYPCKREIFEGTYEALR